MPGDAARPRKCVYKKTSERTILYKGQNIGRQEAPPQHLLKAKTRQNRKHDAKDGGGPQFYTQKCAHSRSMRLLESAKIRVENKKNLIISYLLVLLTTNEDGEICVTSTFIFIMITSGWCPHPVRRFFVDPSTLTNMYKTHYKGTGSPNSQQPGNTNTKSPEPFCRQ